MLFNNALDDYSSKTVMDYLLSKHTIDAAPVDHVNAYLQSKEKTTKASEPIVKDGKVTLRKESVHEPVTDTKKVLPENEHDIERLQDAPPVVKPVPVKIEDIPVEKSNLELPAIEEQHEPLSSGTNEKSREVELHMQQKPQEEEESPVLKPKQEMVVNVCSGNEDPFKGTHINCIYVLGVRTYRSSD